MRALLPPASVDDLNRRFEQATAGEIVRWLLDESGLQRVAVASSFQAEGVALIHMATRIRPDVPVLFLETGFHFQETLAFRNRIVELLGANVVELRGERTPTEQERALGPRLYERDPSLCCRLNKVEPLNAALRDLDGWLTGLRRDSAPTRANAPIVDQYELEEGKTIVKVSPLATWTKRDVWRYLRDNDLPRHPLYELGYASIGCAPCTRALFPGEDDRAGRWAGVEKVECGIHLKG